MFVGAEGAPGLVVEQRRTESGWQVLVALVDTTSDGGSGLAVRWFDASHLRPAGTSAAVDTPGEPADTAAGTSRPPGAARDRRS
ncbi:hypothetical protein MOPEL_029_01110 [Mobilicoccus pelagius NBRC 104925]|uniref:Uncharacterized protein n=1 Tax=Mobilicoccus pelagius NBRC 104925 TaxID=1089455 RepID=H5UQ25_9MICO|nr:hypothetical protein MOPEL_029_01110 [Mobilicoccus pelagius NBRC 104925]